MYDCAKVVSENFGLFVEELCALSNKKLKASGATKWFSSDLSHPMFSYGYSSIKNSQHGQEDCVADFIQNKVPFFFCNGLLNEGQAPETKLIGLGADSLGSLDGMYFDLNNKLPSPSAAIDVSLKLVDSLDLYNDFAVVMCDAAEVSGEIGKSFFNDFSRLDSNKFKLIIAYADKKPVGCSMLYLTDKDIAGNYFDWVLPQYRKKGVDSLMILKRLELAREHGRKALIAQCMDTSTRLYSSLGFKKVGELDFYGKMGYE